MSSPSISPSNLFIFARDQAFFKSLFFSGDRGSDLGIVKNPEILRFLDDSGLLFHHVGVRPFVIYSLMVLVLKVFLIRLFALSLLSRFTSRFPLNKKLISLEGSYSALQIPMAMLLINRSCTLPLNLDSDFIYAKPSLMRVKPSTAFVRVVPSFLIFLA